MVEKKQSKKTTSRTRNKASESRSKNTAKKGSCTIKQAHDHTAEVKTVVKTVPMKNDSCSTDNCCSTKKSCCCVMKIVMLVLLALNIVITGLLLAQKLWNNEEKIAELGGKENYKMFQDMTSNTKYIDAQTKNIDNLPK